MIAYVWRQAGLGDDIYFDFEALFQIVGQRDQVEQAPILCHIDKEIEIAGRAVFAASG